MSRAGIAKVLEDLQKLGKIGEPRRRGRENYTFDCPFHSKGRRQSTPSFGVHIETGQWNCFSSDCGRKGPSIQALYANLTGRAEAEVQSLYPSDAGATDDLRSKLSAPADKDVPAPMAPFPRTVSIDSDAAASSYMASRRIPRTVWELARASFAPDARLKASMDGKATFGGRRIILPIKLPGAVGFMGRSIGPDRTPKWRPISDVGKLFYDPLGLLERANPPAAVSLVEGEFDVLACIREGLDVLGCFQAHLGIHRAVMLQRFDRVLTLFDGDDAGRKGTAKAFTECGRILGQRLISHPLFNNMDPAKLPVGFGKSVKARLNERTSFADTLRSKLHA